MSDNKQKPPFHHKVEPGSSSSDRKPFHHDVKSGSSFPSTEPGKENTSPDKKLPPEDQRPTLKSLLSPKYAALIPEGHAAGDYILSAAELLTLERFKGDKENDPEDLLPLPPAPKFSPHVTSLPPKSPLAPISKLPPVNPLGEMKERPQIAPGQKAIRAARDRVSKRRTRLIHEIEVIKHGPQGEVRSQFIINKVVSIDLSQISIDPKFRNCRPLTNGEELSLLIESIRHEGIKVPIAVIEVPGEDNLYYIRSGFHRVEAVKFLKWRSIPAIVLPVDTPEEDEYWINIIENTARKNLSTYEVAKSAQNMRDRFGIDYRSFAQKAGYSDKYIDNLLRTIDRLPDPILERWKEKSGIPVDYYYKWASMLPHEAIDSFNIFAGLHPHVERIHEDNSPPTEREPRPRGVPVLTTSAYGFKRMHDIRFAIEAAPNIDPEVRKNYLKIVDFCLGCEVTIPGIYDDKTKRLKIANRRKKKLNSDDE